jgi:hypothetical protein
VRVNLRVRQYCLGNVSRHSARDDDRPEAARMSASADCTMRAAADGRVEGRASQFAVSKERELLGGRWGRLCQAGEHERGAASLRGRVQIASPASRVVVQSRRREGPATMLRSLCCVRYEQDDHADPPQVPATVRLGRFCAPGYLAHGPEAESPDRPEHGEAWATARPPRTCR